MLLEFMHAQGLIAQPSCRLDLSRSPSSLLGGQGIAREAELHCQGSGRGRISQAYRRGNPGKPCLLDAEEG